MGYELEIHPAADAEYDALLSRDRATAYDLGNHFRILETIVEHGFAEGLRPVHLEPKCDVYLFFGSRTQMFLATHVGRLLLVHLVRLGTEYQQTQALQDAIERSRSYFRL